MLHLSLVIAFILLAPGFVRGQGLPVVMQAEAGHLGSDFEVVAEGGVTFARPRTNLLNSNFPGDSSKVITFNVSFAEAGDYHFYARIRVGPGQWADDSFFLGRRFGHLPASDAGSWFNVNGLVPVGHTSSFDVVTGSGNAGPGVWKWVNISSFLNPSQPVIFSVTDVSTPLIFAIGAREDGFDIDKVAFASANLQYSVSDLELVRPGSPVGGFPPEAYRVVKTYVDPVLPGSHPDQTILRAGNNFFRSGSSFHFAPYVPIYRSTDLVHWEVISRVVPPSWPGSINDTPSGGIWQGALARFGGFYWVYYSINSQQHFSRATSPWGPWSAPTRVTSPNVRGYDNSIFVDDDGLPYMLMKDGPLVNRIQRVDTVTGQLTGSLMNLDWVNDDRRYSWAEGPKMVKRDGWYYYFIAGNVGGGQWTLRSRSLVQDSTAWEELGPFFLSVTDAGARFRTPNHLTQPVLLDDGTWWALSHSFAEEAWAGQGRQGLLHQVLWDENSRPFGTAPTSMPRLKPALPCSGIPWFLPRSDSFNPGSLGLNWYFFRRALAPRVSLAARDGWLTIDPGTSTAHILQLEAGRYYNIASRLEFNATLNGQEAGIYITNGNESITAMVYTGFNNGRVIGFRFTDAQQGAETRFEVENTIGNTVWLKIERNLHQLAAYYSSDGIAWTRVGDPVNVAPMDRAQPSWNWWVGTSKGLFATRAVAHFDNFIFRDGFAWLPAIGRENFFGVATRGTGANIAVTNNSANGGWLMIGGVNLGEDQRVPERVEVMAAALLGGTLEVWADDLEGTGTLVATINVTPTGGEANWVNFSAPVQGIAGQRDIFLRWNGPANAFLVRDLRFVVNAGYLTGIYPGPGNGARSWNVFPNPFHRSFTVSAAKGNTYYKLFDSTGVLHLSGIIDGGAKVSVEGAGLPPGIYFLRLTSGYISEVFKMVKKR